MSTFDYLVRSVYRSLWLLERGKIDEQYRFKLCLELLRKLRLLRKAAGVST